MPNCGRALVQVNIDGSKAHIISNRPTNHAGFLVTLRQLMVLWSGTKT